DVKPTRRSGGGGRDVARAITPPPRDHGLALARVLRVVAIIAARPDTADTEVVAQLVAEGVGRVDAELLVRFVPSALSQPLLKRLGVGFCFDFYVARTRAGRVVHLPLAAEHYFTAALAWAEGLLGQEPAARPITREAFHAVAGRSPEMDCANQLLERGGPEGVRGAVGGPLALGGVTAEEIAASRSGGGRGRPWWRVWGQGGGPDHKRGLAR